MPKRMIDFDAMWASDKLAACEESCRVEYAWLYGIADANGSFELTNLRTIWGRISAIRPKFAIKRLESVLGEFHSNGLLFIWDHDGKKYGHWTGSDRPGRLPKQSHRGRYEIHAPQVPQNQLDAYIAGVISRHKRESTPGIASKNAQGVGVGVGVGVGAGTGEGEGGGDKPTPAPTARAGDNRFCECKEFAFKSFEQSRKQKPTWSTADYTTLTHLITRNPGISSLEFERRWQNYMASTDHFIVAQGGSLKFFCSRFDSFSAGPLTDKKANGGKLSGRELTEANLRATGFIP
jgi:hypothetical protein